MLIRDKKLFAKGAMLMLSFLVVFLLIFSPIFPGGVNGLHFSDDLFNKLSKGSSYFIPEVAKAVKPFEGKQISVEVKPKSAEDLKIAQALLAKVGATAEVKGEMLGVSCDLGAILGKVVADADLLYKDDAKPLTDAYGMDGKVAMKGWWSLLSSMIKPLQKAKQIEEANVVNMVNQKAIEPAYNFYGIPAESIMTKIPTVAGLLIFYVLYTMWYGYAIFDMFGGIGLSMSKSKIKKEA
ncbi:hypothetical protein DFW101_3615 [Solidesulfovibrio carbinoliphilus subsp. oakridgensis]|uniref:Uncharacterized protein n=1 Tax=Solidesulfovibrio carbinoliphilus subsp. oakridgensis TaxID=694327 RepID=G7Q5Q2_9BACT|nr:hypothetical protein [Solidesulfovibrio carbinoliphilus]EHJ49611.1 hypothetical protein DFW101_3615 [Solidesulfovibrio carbinoliphilus subsp. oakridgensis]